MFFDKPKQKIDLDYHHTIYIATKYYYNKVMEDIKSIIKRCVKSILQQRIFESEMEFQIHLANELKKDLVSSQVIIEYNCANFVLFEEEDLRKKRNVNEFGFIDIVIIINKENIYPIELKVLLYKDKVRLSTDAEGGFKKFVEDIERAKSLFNKNKGYFIYLTNSKDEINEKIKKLKNNVYLISEEDWECEGSYSYLFKEINFC